MKTQPDNYPFYLRCDEWVRVLDEMNIGAFTIDGHRRITCFNKSACILLGRQGSDAIGKDCREVFHDIPCYSACPFHEKSETDSGPDVEIIDQEAVRHCITRYSTPFYGSGGRIGGCLTILQDHSPIVELISKVSYEERSMKVILDSLNIGICTVNRGENITFFNTAAEKITGSGRADVLGKKFFSIFGKDGQCNWKLLKSSMSDGFHRNSQEGEIKSREGETVPIRAQYLPLQNEQGQIVGGMVTLQDLTLAKHLDQVVQGRSTFFQMIGRDSSMQKIFEIARVVAPSDATVLIEGVTGTGKDMLARIIHSASRRSEMPMIKLNCAALPENLLESELFGYVRGAFTGADRDKPGRFQEADKGTIFLDEIGDLPLSLQAKLLRVLEEKCFYPLGSRRVVTVDVRIIAATNRGLLNLVEKGLFREDLFYRLNVVQIELPALKSRRSDIPLLIRHIARKVCAKQAKRIPGISETAMDVLLNYDYPGNIRELENILEHALIVCQDASIDERHLPSYLKQRMHPERTSKKVLEAGAPDATGREREVIIKTLQQFQWNRKNAARSLRMDRTTLWRKMKRYGLIA
ncbi:MAG: sigma 54-interacting transcriptional regulator [Pseudomonadota bacterium]